MHRKPEPRTAHRGTRAALAALALTVAGIRGLTVYTENIHWDEFGLLSRAAETLQTHQLKGGGRPGLAVLILLPIVGDCPDELAVVHRARLVWSLFTAAYLAGVFVLIRRLLSTETDRDAFAALGTAFLALLPPFIRWSLQVRTDQLMLAFGIWAVVALLSSLRQGRWGLLSGLLFGLGFLASQKVVYLGGLGALLCLLALIGRRASMRQALVGGACALATLAVTLVLYRPVVGLFFELPPEYTVAKAMSTFDYYRKFIGFSAYANALPASLGQLLLLALALAASAWQLRAGRKSPRLAAALCVLALGIGVGLFHAGAFHYFLLTLALYFALAFALLLPALREAATALWRKAPPRLLFGLALGALAAPALFQTWVLTLDHQYIQDASLSFVHRHLAREAHVFQAEQALFCQSFAPRFAFFVSERVHREFFEDQRRGEAAVDALMEEFRRRPVRAVVDLSRILSFPDRFKRFVLDHYVQYYGSVWLPGYRLASGAGSTRTVETFVEGDYRWLPAQASADLSVDRVPVAAGGTVRLERGSHTLELRGEGDGTVVLAVNEPPRPTTRSFFRGFTTW